jgi:hypothetical protein
VLGALALALGACRVPYRPLTPRAASVDGISAAVVKLSDSGQVASVGGSISQVAAMLEFAGQQAPPLAGAWLAPEGSPPCSAGVRALENSPDPFSSLKTHRQLTFDRTEIEAAGLLEHVPTVLDVDVLPADLAGPRRCLRLPLTDATARPAWAARSRWFLGTELRLIAPVSGVHDEIGTGGVFGIYGGWWLGPVRLRLDWEFGEASTAHPGPAGYSKPVAELLGGAAAVEWFPLRVGHIGLGANVGYEWLFTDFAANMGKLETNEYGSGPRGPRATLRLARVPAAPTWPGFWNRKDGWAAGFDLSVARWTGPGGLAATFVGIGVGLDTGYWW